MQCCYFLYLETDWMCDKVLGNAELMSQIKQGNYDLLLIDVFRLTRCYYIIPYKLDIPHIGITTYYDPWQFRIPALPSFSPFAFTTPMTEDMTLWEVITNIYVMLEFFWRPALHPYDEQLVTRFAIKERFLVLPLASYHIPNTL